MNVAYVTKPESCPSNHCQDALEMNEGYSSGENSADYDSQPTLIENRRSKNRNRDDFLDGNAQEVVAGLAH